MGQKYNSFVEHIHARSAALTEFRILCQALRRMAYCVYIGVSAVNVGMYAIHVPLLLDKGCLFGVPSNRVCGRWECLHTPRLLAQIRYSWLRSGVDIGFDQALLLVFEPRVGKWVYMNNLYIYMLMRPACIALMPSDRSQGPLCSGEKRRQRALSCW